MSTALHESIRLDRRAMIARRTTGTIMCIVSRFIPDACRRDALNALNAINAAIAEGGYELTSRLEREQYEAWKATLLAGDLPRIETT